MDFADSKPPPILQESHCFMYLIYDFPFSFTRAKRR